jgi:pimeloyl-ACP methyl ester carboxylesterase
LQIGKRGKVERGVERAPYLVAREAVINGKNTLIIAYRGTFYGEDWKQNKKFFPVTVMLGQDRVNVHNGIHERFREIEAFINRSELIKKIINIDNILVVGQSLGGALASMKALELKGTYPRKNIKLITLSDPPVFGKNSAKRAELRLEKENIVRFYRRNDVIAGVARLPYSYFGHVFPIKTDTQYSNIKRVASLFFRNHNIAAIAADILSVVFNDVRLQDIIRM